MNGFAKQKPPRAPLQAPVPALSFSTSHHPLLGDMWPRRLFSFRLLANPWRGKGAATPQCSGLAAARGSNSHGLVSGFQVCLNHWLWFPPLLQGPCFYRTRSNKTLKHVLISQGKSGPWRSMFQKNTLSWIRATVMELPPPTPYLNGTSQGCLSPAKTENLY